MIPKTALQRQVMSLSEHHLPPLSDKQRQWAIDKCFGFHGYICTGNVWCQCCGGEFEHKVSHLGVEVDEVKVVCPHCGKLISLSNSRKKRDKSQYYFSIVTICRGFQVIRHFLARKELARQSAFHNIIDSTPCILINEAVQIWIDDQGKETIVARNVIPGPFIYDNWDFSKPMSIKIPNRSAYAPNKYDIHSDYIYPIRKVLPLARRNGYTSCFDEFSQSEYIKLLLTDKEAEMLSKTRQFGLLAYKWLRCVREYRLPFQHSIRIANRNRYIVKDASLWLDYLKLLKHFGKDTHNAHYVCHANLEAEHDKLVARKNAEKEKAERERRIKEALEHEEQYRSEKGKFFGICFGNDHIVISVISSVMEIANEGSAMHHCVFECGYHLKPDSLILSAKDTQGNRIETVEVDLKTFKVVQSRGVCNKNTDLHEEIINLVNNNMNLIRKAA